MRWGYSKEEFWNGRHPSVLCFHTTLLCQSNFKEQYWRGCRWCTIWYLLKCVFILKWLSGKFPLGLCFIHSQTVTSESTEKLHIAFSDPATHISTPNILPPLGILISLSPSHQESSEISAQKLFPQDVQSLWLLFPNSVWPWEKMCPCPVVLRSAPAQANQTERGCGSVWQNTFRSLSPWFLLTSTAETFTYLALTNSRLLLCIQKATVNLPVWTTCHPLCVCPLASPFCYGTKFLSFT